MPCLKHVSRPPHDLLKHNFLDKCPVSLVLTPQRRPSLDSRRVGSCITRFGACSAFTHVTAYRLAKSPKATLYAGGSSSFVTFATAPIASGWSEPVPGRDSHPLLTSAFSRRTRNVELPREYAAYAVSLRKSWARGCFYHRGDRDDWRLSERCLCRGCDRASNIPRVKRRMLAQVRQPVLPLCRGTLGVRQVIHGNFAPAVRFRSSAKGID
jgi:hypothetical protein